MNDMSMESMQPANADHDIPCHGSQKQKQNQSTHCKGDCLCLHFSLGKTLTTMDSGSFGAPVSAKKIPLPRSESVTSLGDAPPRRPPKSFS